MKTEDHSAQPTLTVLPSASAPRKRAADRSDHLKELQKLPTIIQQPETKNWTLVPVAFPELNNFYRL